MVHKKWSISYENENVWVARSFVNSSGTSRNATRFPTAIRIYSAVYLPSAIRYHLEAIAVTIRAVLVQYFASRACISVPINLYKTILTWLRKICFSRASRKYLLYSDILAPLRESRATLKLVFNFQATLYLLIIRQYILFHEIYNFTR